MSITIPFSEACERNKDVILEVIRPYISTLVSVLEIGTGTAQHAVHFARALPQLKWQTSDQEHYLEGICAQLEVVNIANVLAPFELNVNQPNWLPTPQRFSAIYTANTFHIMSQTDVEQFFAGLTNVVTDDAYLFVYGPFKYNGEFTSASNAEFDSSLRSRGVGSAIKDFEFVNQLANDIGFSLVADNAMPANNQCLIWQCR